MTFALNWRRANHHSRGASLAVGVCLALCGCQSLGTNPFQRDRELDDTGRLVSAPIDPVEGIKTQDDTGVVATAKKSSNRVTAFLTGREPESRDRAKQHYQEGHALFIAAQQKPREDAKKDFTKAAKAFRQASEAAPQTALQQDALFMQAESLFFADDLTDAADIYEKLQKDFPRNRHNDRAAARLFSISQYWIETEKANEGRWTMPVNFIDDKRPAFDVDGHAIRVLDQIRYDDPTGRLADDATMAAAAEYIRQGKFELADEFLTDLREAFPDSDHLFLAHLLGIRCKLNVYAGPKYSTLVLDETEKLIRQTRTRFPDRLADPKYRDMVARAAAEVAYLQAEHVMHRAVHREKRREYGSARILYSQILENHAETPFADKARERLTEIEGYEALPKQPLQWMTKVFPDSRSGVPLQLNTGTPASNDGKTLMR